MVSEVTQPDGLPTPAALIAFQESVEEIDGGLDKLMNKTDWYSFTRGPEVGDQYRTIQTAAAKLRALGGGFKITTVSKVVRA